MGEGTVSRVKSLSQVVRELVQDFQLDYPNRTFDFPRQSVDCLLSDIIDKIEQHEKQESRKDSNVG